MSGLTILCESTGSYEQKLLQTARRLGHHAALVNPEHVAGYKTIESNDTGKTDQKDPRVIHLLARMGKTLTHRHLPERYRCLRRLVAYYEDDETVLSATRQRIQGVIGDLFPDYDKSATFTFVSTGAALAETYQFNPYRIANGGYVRFRRVMKRRVRGVRSATLEYLFACAKASARYRKSEAEVAVLTCRLKALWSDYERLTERRAALRMEIEALGAELKEAGERPRPWITSRGSRCSTWPASSARLGRSATSAPGARSCATPGSTSASAPAAPTAGRTASRRRDAPAAQDPRADDLPAASAGAPLRPLLPPQAPGGHARAEGEGGGRAQVPRNALFAGDERRDLRSPALCHL